jgi:radical SAM superfamily enzyme YgiQ (UPF0313 family)
MPLGLLMLASMVRDFADVKIIDGYSHAASIEETIHTALNTSPDIIGISMPFAFSQKPAIEIARGIKLAIPDIPIITGGNQATFRSDEIIENPFIDYIILGEGEETFSELVKNIIDGNSDPVIGVKTAAGPCETRSLIHDIDELPYPSFDLLESFPDFYTPRLITSRGCPFTCPYCSTMQFWTKRYRGRSAKSVVEEILWQMDEFGIKRISFADDTYNINRKRCREISEALIEANTGIKWGASFRPDLLARDDIDLYVESGMSGMFMGMESGSPEILKKLTRKHDLEFTRDLIAYAESKGVEVHCSFMVGLPDETTDDIELTIEYADSLPASTLGFHIFHPLPGSEYGEDISMHGLEFENPDTAIDTLGSIDGGAPVKTKHLTSTQIVDYYWRARDLAAKRLEKIR